jgi:nucleoside-diphosphate-sugar epimerase
MIARAFLARSGASSPGLIFARGVARSDETSIEAFAREFEALDAAIDRSNEIGGPIVYFSGAPVYGKFTGPASEADPLRPLTPYGKHQAECEDRVRGRAEGFLILRLPNAVGRTTNTRQLIPSLVRQIGTGLVQVQRHARRDLIDIEDVVDVAIGLLDAGRRGDTFNVASGHCVPIPEIVDEVSVVLGASPKRFFLDAGVPQEFDTTALLRTLPSTQFAGDYWQGVLRRYVPELRGATG